jgi:hypothetical protein
MTPPGISTAYFLAHVAEANLMRPVSKLTRMRGAL